jgi:16S rRNA (guanine527-N7)-methyltransferase
MTTDAFDVKARLSELLALAELEPLEPSTLQQFADYCSLFVRWNTRTNLSSIRDSEGILQRHFVESIACAQALPDGIRSLLDFGSGGGFPGVPIALCRPEIAVTLAESQGKKAAFLQEAVRVLQLSAKVHAGRAEELHEQFDCVTLRAVDHMEKAVSAASGLVRPGGTLLLMTSEGVASELERAAGAGFSWLKRVSLPGGESRLLDFGLNAPA